MKVLLTGATGYIGSSVLAALIDAHHDVTAVVRSDASASTVSAAGATPIVGSLFDAHWLAEHMAHHDGAIHTAAGSDENDAAMNDAVLEAAINAFAGTDKPFVHTGGVWTYGNNATIDEDDAPAPPPLTAWRPSGEDRILASRVKASVIQPAIVYGRGGGIPAMLRSQVTVDGEFTVIGSGQQHWTTVHVDDLADLYLRALTGAPGGRRYVGANGHNPTVNEIAATFATTLTPESADATVARLGAFGEALLLDQQATGQRARHELGWAPSRPLITQQA